MDLEFLKCFESTSLKVFDWLIHFSSDSEDASLYNSLREKK
jgi:hypothetical protein